MAGGKIFINYRREDSGGYARSLFDRLNARFPKQVFMDVGGSIEFGLDFAEEIQKAVSSCDALIVLMGRQWLTLKDASGRRRLDDPGDFVRLEIAAALKRNVRVIPALVGSAGMPTEEDLPPELKPLTRRQAVLLSDQDWEHTVNRLIKTLEGALDAAAKAIPQKPRGPVGTSLPLARVVSGALAALLVIIAVVYSLTRRRHSYRNLAEPTVLSSSASSANRGANRSAAGTESAGTLPPQETRTQESVASSNKLPGGAVDQSEPGTRRRIASPILQIGGARQAVRRGQHIDAMAAAPKGESFDTLVLDGDVAYQSGLYQKALDTYLKAYRIRNADRGVRRRIATTLTLLGRAEEAQKYQ